VERRPAVGSLAWTEQSPLCVTDRNRDQFSVSGLRLDSHRLGSGAVRIEVAEREVVGSLRVDMDNELLGTVLDGEALDLTESITRLDLNDEPLNPLGGVVSDGVRTRRRRRGGARPAPNASLQGSGP